MSQIQNPPLVRPKGETMKARVGRLYGEGILKCSWPQHFVFDRLDRNSVRPASQAFIISLMEPYVEAQCYCERKALDDFQHWTQPVGTFAHRFICEGALCVGFGEKPSAGHAAKRVCPVPFQLTKEQREELHRCFPGYLFYSKQAGYHDHPIAHVKTMMCSAMMMEAVPKGTPDAPTHVLDLYGNPGPNEARNLRDNRVVCHTTCHVVTPKDALRKVQKWGPQHDAAGQLRWHDTYIRDVGTASSTCDHAIMSQVTHITMTHTLYYVSYDEILSVLEKSAEGCVLHAVVHKFGPGNSGTLNRGEMEWYREERNFGGKTTSWITQINRESKETYDHRDTDRFFGSQCYWNPAGTERNPANGITWTSRKLTDEVYLLEFTKFRCTAADCVEERTPVEVPTGKADPYSPLGVRRAGGVPLFVKTGTELHPLRPELSVEFDSLRKRIGNKVRTAETWKAHVSTCKIHFKQKGMPDITAEELNSITCLSFWCGYEAELNQASNLFDDNHRSTIYGVRLARYGAFASKTGLVHGVAKVVESLAGKHVAYQVADVVLKETIAIK